MARKHLVLGFFADEAAAEAAVDALKAWDKLDDDVKLHSLTVMTLDGEGKLRVSNLWNSRGVGAAKGFGVGLVMVIAAGPIGPALTLPVLGGAIGAVYKPGLGLDASQRERIAAVLGTGKAAVGVLVKHEEEAAAVSAKLAELRGEPETHEVSDDVEAAAEQAAQRANDA